MTPLLNISIIRQLLICKYPHAISHLAGLQHPLFLSHTYLVLSFSTPRVRFFCSLINIYSFSYLIISDPLCFYLFHHLVSFSIFKTNIENFRLLFGALYLITLIFSPCNKNILKITTFKFIVLNNIDGILS